jgi:hypothetical protein
LVRTFAMLGARLVNDAVHQFIKTWFLVVCLAMLATPAWSQSSIEKIKTDYRTVSAKLDKHLVRDAWIDDDPESPRLLGQQWSLAGEWVAEWLNAHPHAGPGGVREAVRYLAPSSTPEYLVLNGSTFLVASPSPVGNVFSSLFPYQVTITEWHGTSRSGRKPLENRRKCLQPGVRRAG